MPLDISKRSHETLLLFILAAIQFAHITDFMILMPLGAQLLKALSITPQQFGILVSSYTFSAGVSGLLGAVFIDRFGRKQALAFAQAGFAIGTILCATAETFETFLAFRVVTGAFGGIQNALILAIIGDVIPFERRGAAMGLVMAAFSAAAVLGVPLGLYLANLYSWHLPFYSIGAFGVLVSGVIWLLVPSLRDHVISKVDRKGPLQIIKENITELNKVKALLLMVFLMMSFFPILPYLTPYLVANVGITEAEIPYIYLAGGALTLFTSRIIGKLSDRFGKKQVLTIMALATMVPVYMLTNMGPATLGYVLIITCILFVTANGRMVTAMSLITSVPDNKTRGSFMSLNSAVQQFAAALATFIGGLFLSQIPNQLPGVEAELQALAGFEYTGYLSIAMTCGVIVWALSLRPRQRPEQT